MLTVKNYLSLIKFSHTIFAMPFALIGFFIGLDHLYDGFDPIFDPLGLPTHWRGEMVSANLDFVLKIFILIILCMILARSAAMAFNRYLDRSIDAKNPRTAIREIPSGIISANTDRTSQENARFPYFISPEAERLVSKVEQINAPAKRQCPPPRCRGSGVRRRRSPKR